ncbi:MAG: DUF1062 domain-containing protein [Roseibium sp.]|uniref:DUF1062 domain-containing protein n=1 Tax=Roseibium sp. TaxID=1936156 RepID=UPI00260B7E03|nr:DUF1062 domain-containing protein [Roseibium sp.]MCV0427383.1 DUF1062 domain-containing protein [Roseibium sp.]
MPFASTSKFRLNANGSRLDAWLIYRCVFCGKRWNRPLFERQPVSSLPQEQLEALQRNDATFAEQMACHTGKLEAVIEQDAQFTIERRLIGCHDRGEMCAMLTIHNPDACRARLDQILAKGLGMSRKDVSGHLESRDFELCDAPKRAIKRPVPKLISVRFLDAEQIGATSLRKRVLGSVISQD